MSTKKLRVLVLICSTRPGATGPAVARWLDGATADRAEELGVELVPVPLADLALPFLDEEEHPSSGVYRHSHTRRWSAMAGAADGFIAITPEYNYGMPATLKNALDYLSAEWAWKPIGFVSYGFTSAGTRAVQHAKQVVTTLRMVPLGATVAIHLANALEAAPDALGGASGDTLDASGDLLGEAPETARDGVRLRPDPARDATGVALLDELTRAANALRPMRERVRPDARPGPVAGSYARALTPDDAPEVTMLQRCCWVEEAVVNDTIDLPPLHESPEDVRAWLVDWDTTGLWRDGRLLGMVRTRRIDDDWHIGRLAVAPDQRGLGLGRWLLHTAEAAATPDCRRAVLFTGAKSLRNIALYENHGYHRTPLTVPNGTIGLAKPLPTNPN